MEFAAGAFHTHCSGAAPEHAKHEYSRLMPLHIYSLQRPGTGSLSLCRWPEPAGTVYMRCLFRCSTTRGILFILLFRTGPHPYMSARLALPITLLARTCLAQCNCHCIACSSQVKEWALWSKRVIFWPQEGFLNSIWREGGKEGGVAAFD